MDEGEAWDADLNPKYWRVTLTMVVNASDSQNAIREVLYKTSDDAESILGVSELPDEDSERTDAVDELKLEDEELERRYIGFRYFNRRWDTMEARDALKEILEARDAELKDLDEGRRLNFVNEAMRASARGVQCPAVSDLAKGMPNWLKIVWDDDNSMAVIIDMSDPIKIAEGLVALANLRADNYGIHDLKSGCFYAWYD